MSSYLFPQCTQVKFEIDKNLAETIDQTQNNSSTKIECWTEEFADASCW